MNPEDKERLTNDLYCEAYCPDCHHGDNLEIPNAERVIEEAYRLGRESLKEGIIKILQGSDDITRNGWEIAKALFQESQAEQVINKNLCPVCKADMDAWESPEGFGTPHDCKVQP